jgi:histidinol-phosphate phosphatase family protein
MTWLSEIDKSWTLFLDRDGVINEEVAGDYVRNVDQFVFLPHVQSSIKLLNKHFANTIIVTNQRCVGRGIITISDLESIHRHMISELDHAGAHIDAIYFAPDISPEAIMRKPNIGMALRAKQEFPQIDFTKSVMIGNSPSDIEFGKNAGMKTVFLETTKPGQGGNADAVMHSLHSFAEALS